MSKPLTPEEEFAALGMSPLAAAHQRIADLEARLAEVTAGMAREAHLVKRLSARLSVLRDALYEADVVMASWWSGEYTSSPERMKVVAALESTHEEATRILAERDQARAEMAAAQEREERLREAARPFAELGRDLSSGICHTGLCLVEDCSRCSRVLALRAALATTGKKP